MPWYPVTERWITAQVPAHFLCSNAFVQLGMGLSQIFRQACRVCFQCWLWLCLRILRPSVLQVVLGFGTDQQPGLWERCVRLIAICFD